MHRLAISILALFVIAAIPGSLRPASAEEQAPTRVGRVSVVAGQLGFHARGETNWSAAAINYPVATGGSFWTDPKSKAEIRIGAQSLALAPNTQIDVTRLDRQVMQIAVPQGRIELHLRQLGDGNSVEVDIPRGGVWLLQPGIYDIAAGTPDSPARIMVFEGSARFVGGTLDQGIKAGEAAVIGGTDTLTATIERAAPDAFVQWCRAHDYREQRLAAPHYISPDMTGYEELDAYGVWRTVGDYGAVWYPRAVGAGWAPYRDGHWAWADPWGWNWIDAAPWGFAPSHYGRWAYLDGGWGWVPGAFAASPVYAPALVAFLADPAAMVASAAAGPYVGWFPLGPGETATGTGAFANRRGTTVVSQQVFASSGRVAGAALPVSGAAVQNARVAAQAPALQPAAARAGGRTLAGPGTIAAGAGIAAGAATGVIAARSAARGGSGFAGPGRGSASALGPAGSPMSARGLSGSSAPAGASFRTRQFATPYARAPQFHGSRFAPGGPSHAAGSRFAAPRAAAQRAMPAVAVRGGGGPRAGGGGGQPHLGGAPHGGGGGGGGGGPHGGGSGAHGGGGGGGGPHGGGANAGGGHGGGKGHG